MVTYSGSLHLDYSQIKPEIIDVNLVSINDKEKSSSTSIVNKTQDTKTQPSEPNVVYEKAGDKEKAIPLNKKAPDKKKRIDSKERLKNTLERFKTESKTETVDYSNITTNTAIAYGTAKIDKKQVLTYKQKLAISIQRNWVYSKYFSKNIKDKEVRILIKIMPDGSVNEIWTKKKSGDNYLDETAIKSIQKSIPFPPLPKGMSFYNIVLIFTPEGLR